MRALRATLFPAPCLGCGTTGGALCDDCAPALSERAVRSYPRLTSLGRRPASIQPSPTTADPRIFQTPPHAPTQTQQLAPTQTQPLAPTQTLPSSATQALSEPLHVGYVGVYAGVWRDAILQFKNGRRDVADACVRLLALRAGKIVPAAARDAAAVGDVLLVGVPTSSRRRRERGFDGGLFLADGLGAAWGIAATPALRLAQTDHQRGKNRHARLQAQGRFECTTHRPPGHVGVLLIDDVLTTGSTLRDACACLENEGIPVLGALTLAFVEG